MVRSCACTCRYYALLSRLEERVIKPRARPGVQSTRVLSPSDSRNKAEYRGGKKPGDVFIHDHPRVGKKEERTTKNILTTPQTSQKQIAVTRTAPAATADRAIRFGNQPQATSPTKPKPLRERPRRDVPRQQASLCSNCGQVWRSSCRTLMHVDESAAYS